MRSADALAIAREVQAGKTRSYVEAAMKLAAYVIEQETMTGSPKDGEGGTSVRPADPSGSDSNAEPVPPEGSFGGISSGDSQADRPTVYPSTPTPLPPPSPLPTRLVSVDDNGEPPSMKHAATCQCTQCLYGHMCKVCGVNYTTAEFCSWQCSRTRF
jgi:hypothetical protein